MQIKDIKSTCIIISILTLTTIHGQTIFQAARQGNLDRIKVILDSCKQIVNAKNHNGMAPIFYALNSRRLNIVQYLVENGADVNAEVQHEGSVMDFALDKGDKPIIDYLLSKGAKAIGAKYVAIKLSNNISQLAYTTGVRSNVLILETPNELAIFDTGYNQAAAEALKKYLTDNFNKPVNYIFNSHTDGDHVAGNKLFGDNVKTVCYTSLEKDFSTINAKKNISPLKGRTGQSFDTYYTTLINGEELIIIPYPGKIHSNEDVIYYFVKSKLVYAGDLISSQTFPLTNKIPAYCAFLEKLIDTLPEDAIYVSGHGGNIDYNGLKKYYEMVKRSVEIIRTNLVQGKDLNTMLNENILKGYEKDYSLLSIFGTDYWIRIVVKALQDKTL